MRFSQIKDLRPEDGERYIITENGKPLMVLMSFEDYKSRFKEWAPEKRVALQAEAAAREAERKEREVKDMELKLLKEGNPFSDSEDRELSLENLPF